MVIYITSTSLFDIQYVIKHELEWERVDLLQAAASVIWHERVFYYVENIVFVHFLIATSVAIKEQQKKSL